MTDSNQTARPTVDIEFGLDSFVPISVDESGQELSCDVVIRNTVEEAVLADAVGIDSFNIAEHYRSDMMDSAGHVILAAIAGRTERIRLGTAVTVLSTQDPVRVFTEFSTLDAVSNGRAQLIVGRGSLTESFPLFGYDLADYEDIFEEKLELLTRLLRDQPVTWLGKFRAPLTNQSLSPPLREGHLPTWVGVGGSPQSVIRAARYRLPLMLAVIAARQSDSRRWSTSTNERSTSMGIRNCVSVCIRTAMWPRPTRKQRKYSGPIEAVAGNSAGKAQRGITRS
jgi:alkanesulfonate monooxygenase SsuD/methylene tetrahydromethanopterin reductase-like flavin-dependent oxidoreductase (luciferase family)